MPMASKGLDAAPGFFDASCQSAAPVGILALNMSPKVACLA
jgi:hypothetical protein